METSVGKEKTSEVLREGVRRREMKREGRKKDSVC